MEITLNERKLHETTIRDIPFSTEPWLMGGFGYPLCMMKVSNCTCQPLHLMPGCLNTPALGSPECTRNHQVLQSTCNTISLAEVWFSSRFKIRHGHNKHKEIYDTLLQSHTNFHQLSTKPRYLPISPGAKKSCHPLSNRLAFQLKICKLSGIWNDWSTDTMHRQFTSLHIFLSQDSMHFQVVYMFDPSFFAWYFLCEKDPTYAAWRFKSCLKGPQITLLLCSPCFTWASQSQLPNCWPTMSRQTTTSTLYEIVISLWEFQREV